MALSTKACSSMTGVSLLKTTGAGFKLLTFILVALSCLSLAVAAPTASEAVSLAATEKRDVTDAALPRHIPEPVDSDSDSDDLLSKRESAGLLWGPVPIGNLRLYVTNPHFGPVGPKFPGGATHVNFHVDRRAPGPRVKWPEVVNLHIVKYSSGNQACLYMWDSVTSKTVFDSCFDDYSTAARQAAQTAKQYVDTLLKNADAIAAVAILAALVAALVAAIGGLVVVAV